MASVMTNLEGVVQEYLRDTEFQQEWQKIAQQRKESIPHYKAIVQKFIDGIYNLDEFCDALKPILQDQSWKVSGDGFMIELNQNGVSTNSDFEANFRFILRNLEAKNVGRQIELFHNLREHTRSQEALLNKTQTKRSGITASPPTRAFIISLFAFWLDRTSEPYICSLGFIRGLYTIFEAKLLLIPTDIQLSNNVTVIDIKSEIGYNAIASILNVLAASQPALKSGEYWAERFFSWVTGKREKNPRFFRRPIDVINNSSDNKEIINTDNEIYILPASIKDEPLKPTPEPLLTQLIAELRRHILIDESIVRDIYHALLGGHLILTGPPGTGKTELARLIPEILWQSEEIIENTNDAGKQTTKRLTTHTAYTTTLVTATADWSTRTLISNIMPIVRGEKVFYHTQYGYLILAILRNWTADPLTPEYWEKAQRIRSHAKTFYNSQQEEEFHGHWLIIDEFNRAPIDIALGEAMTALSSGEALQLLIAGKAVQLPLPKDFRIIGTLNNFDRHYLNQISEALKRRFTFVEILPPSRVHRQAEQAMVLYKALKEVAHIDNEVNKGQGVYSLLEGDIKSFSGLLRNILYRDRAEITRVARAMDVAENTIYRWMNGSSEPRAAYLKRLLDVLPKYRDQLSYVINQTFPGVLDDASSTYHDEWNNLKHPLRKVFDDTAWPLFEVIRIYRQLGTAQAIALVRQVLIRGILEDYKEQTQWQTALDTALSNVIADQLQVLLPDELDVLLWHLKLEKEAFIQKYHTFISDLSMKRRRLAAHLEVLHRIVNGQGEPLLADEAIERLLDEEEELSIIVPEILTPELLTEAFHLDHPPYKLPQFMRRLRTFKAEQGL